MTNPSSPIIATIAVSVDVSTDESCDNFWKHLTAFYYQQGACCELNVAVVGKAYGMFTNKTSPGPWYEFNVWVFFNCFSGLRLFRDVYQGRALTDRVKQTIRDNPAIGTNISVCRNMAIATHGEFLQMLNESKNKDASFRRLWDRKPKEICQHLLRWSDHQLRLAYSGSKLFIFNFLLRLEQLVALVIGQLSECKHSERQDLIDQHHLLTTQLAEYLPRGNYRACFEEETNEDAVGRLTKMDEEKWITGLPKALNQLTNDYCRFNILSDSDVELVLERVKQITMEVER